MPRMLELQPENLPDPYGEGELDDEYVCERCGAYGLTWLNTGTRWALFEEQGRKHVCRALDSDFENLT